MCYVLCVILCYIQIHVICFVIFTPSLSSAGCRCTPQLLLPFLFDMKISFCRESVGLHSVLPKFGWMPCCQSSRSTTGSTDSSMDTSNTQDPDMLGNNLATANKLIPKGNLPLK